MGGCVSVQLSFGQVVSDISHCLCGKGNYIRSLEDNLKALDAAARELEARRNDLLRRIADDEDRGLHQLDEVRVWLSRVRIVENQVDDMLGDGATEIQRLCLCGYFSKNFLSSYCYGEKVFKMRREVEDLRSKGVFEVVTSKAPISKVEERPIQPIVGREDTLERAWQHLMEDGVGVLGFYGMGGVGKTTILTQINNKFLKIGDGFDIVIWITVSKDQHIQKIQEEIGEKLGLIDEEWEIKWDTHKKASNIHKFLAKKRFVLLLDDLWSKVSFIDIGVPFPSRENGCKVVFTTRSKDVCGRMGVDIEMEIKCLVFDDAWDLFRKKVGKITLGSHRDIPKLAKIVTTKCHGLPLALNVIGETMASKRMVQEWYHAIHVLTSFATEFSGMEDEILSVLKYSYDNLKGNETKMCFVYCALFPEDYRIRKDELVDYLIGEGIIDGSENVERAENQGYDIIGTLVRACLVMEEGHEWVIMHDVVREMALWVASHFGRQKEYFIVQTGIHLHQIPEVKNWKAARRMSFMCNQIREISGSPKCLQLETMFLRDNKLVSISSDFFQSMPRLLVLDISTNRDLTELPEEISELVSLQYLNLSWTKVKRLPSSLQKLKKLMHLNLEHTDRLESIFGISGLSNLRTLRLLWSSVVVDVDAVKELQLLEHLKVLTIDLRVTLAVEQFLNDQSLAICTRNLIIRHVRLESAGLSFLETMDSLRELRIVESTISKMKIGRRSNGREMASPLHHLTSPFFPNLSKVDIRGSGGIRDLTWLLFAPNLATLYVSFCNQLEEVISEEKATRATNEHPNIVPFGRLEVLDFRSLRDLKSVYSSPLPFSCLRSISVRDCPKLRKLPLGSMSVPKLEDLVIYYTSEEWLERVEWENKATKHRFLPLFRK